MVNTNDVSFSNTRTFYTFGILEGEGKLSPKIDSFRDVENICLKIAADWESFIDIKDVEEEGYPSAYAHRVILERYGKDTVNISSNENVERNDDLTLPRIFYMYGYLQSKNLLDEDIEDLEQVEEIALRIEKSWKDKIDIQNQMENDFVTDYAERVFLKNYSRK